MAKVMVSMPDDLLAEIDRIAEETGRSRSGLLQHVFRLYQLNKLADRPPIEDPKVREAYEGILEIRKKMPKGIDWTAEIRRDRDEHARKFDK